MCYHMVGFVSVSWYICSQIDRNFGSHWCALENAFFLQNVGNETRVLARIPHSWHGRVAAEGNWIRYSMTFVISGKRFMAYDSCFNGLGQCPGPRAPRRGVVGGGTACQGLAWAKAMKAWDANHQHLTIHATMYKSQKQHQSIEREIKKRVHISVID